MTTDLVERLLADMREVMSAARPATETGFEGLTLREWASALKCSPRTVNRHLVDLQERGLLEVGKVPRPSLDGRLFMVPAYRPRVAEDEQQG